MRRYSFQLRAPKKVAPAVEPAAEEVSYRDLQARAKELDIPANQSREDLEAAIAEAQSDD